MRAQNNVLKDEEKENGRGDARRICEASTSVNDETIEARRKMFGLLTAKRFRFQIGWTKAVSSFSMSCG